MNYKFFSVTLAAESIQILTFLITTIMLATIFSSILLIFGLGAPDIIIIAIVILLLFCGKKIPELMKGIGKGVKSFKNGMNEVQDEINKPLDEEKKDSEKK